MRMTNNKTSVKPVFRLLEGFDGRGLEPGGFQQDRWILIMHRRSSIWPRSTKLSDAHCSIEHLVFIIDRIQHF
jgi:hypothetical protein